MWTKRREKSPHVHSLKLSTVEAGGPVWADGVTQRPPKLQWAPSPPFSGASLPVLLQATDARQQEENFLATFLQRPRKEKKKKIKELFNKFLTSQTH